jgi:hypothetical protein
MDPANLSYKQGEFMKKQWVSFTKYASAAAAAAFLLFFIFTIIAMIAYPGGTYYNHASRGYSFGENFFSDLGMTATFEGKPKTLSFILFSLALGSSGLASVILFLAAPPFFKKRKAALSLALSGSAVGIIAGLCYIGVACTPWNIYLPVHLFFVKTAFLLILIASIFYTIILASGNVLPQKYTAVLGLFSLCAAGYSILLFFGPGFDTKPGLLIQVAGQKIIVYMEIFSFFIISAGIFRETKRQSK